MTTFITPARARDPAALVQAASSLPIEQALSNVSLGNGWLPSNHVYANVVGALRPNSTGIDGLALAEYVAYSMPIHVADGWTLLARGLDAVKAGDVNSAIHMAYYAELRAGMALLAAEGVGVFNSRHVAIAANYATSDLVNLGTHDAVWELLKEWGADAHRSPTILDAIRVEQKTISEWLDEANVSQRAQGVVASTWLKEWSMDLERFSRDRDARNEVSYRPRRIVTSNAPLPDVKSRVVEPLLRIWDSLEPSPERGGAAVDVELLARALSYAYDRDNRTTRQWNNFVDRELQSASDSLRALLKQPLGSNDRIVAWAQESSFPPTANAVLARATLLLRIANAVCAQRMDQSRIGWADLEFWWKALGQEYGLWTDGDEPADFGDLWEDVKDARLRVETSIGSCSPPIEMKKIHSTFGTEAAITQYPRALFWLLGLT